MTVCIAGINHHFQEPVIIAACDRKISFAGGYFSAEGIAMKIKGINNNWSVMTAGDVSPMVPIVEAIQERTKRLNTKAVRQFALECSQAYQQERRTIIENEVLVNYDIENYADYRALKKSEPDMYLAISEEIKKKEEGWELLIVGFDKLKGPHIFVIGEHGRIQYCDTEGFAAIGSGGWRALVALSSYPFKRNLPFTEAIFSVMAAKFAAESQSYGVGEETIVALLERNQRASPVMSDFLVKTLRKLWHGLPRLPEGAKEEIISDLGRVHKMMQTVNQFRDSTLLRLIGKEIRVVKPLNAQKSAGQQ